jgi:hypothetical protein
MPRQARPSMVICRSREHSIVSSHFQHVKNFRLVFRRALFMFANGPSGQKGRRSQFGQPLFFSRDGASSGVPPCFPDCPLSLKQWNCPRSSAEHALRFARKMLLKGRGLLEMASLLLHGALRCCCWRERDWSLTDTSHGPRGDGSGLARQKSRRHNMN